jgi:GTP-binding protein Era
MESPNPICGAVAVLGKPNVGKSTFLNAALGQKLAIVSPKPQTTRGSMAGIFQDSDSQIVFYDTPGIHQPRNKLAHYMIDVVEEVLKGSDAALFLIDAQEGIKDEDRLVAKWLQEFKKPVWVLLNKSDLVSPETLSLLRGRVAGELGSWNIFVVSALKAEGVTQVIGEIKRHLPHQPPLFSEDELTDKTMREISAELIREQCFLQLKMEVPFGVAVLIDQYEEREKPQPVLIQATIYVEKDSQKGIIIGAKGAQLKALGTAARQEIEKMLDQKVFLELWVKVLKNWRKDGEFMKRLGYITK